MKIKFIYKFLFAAVLALQLSACDNNTDADPKFDKTPTERINAQMAELKEALLSSPEGWKAVYFTDNTILGGYTHLFKFASDGTVEMASDFDESIDTQISEFSEYQIQLGSTVSLTFTTKNKIHFLSESDNYPIAALRAKGYLGDFQFLYYGQENGQIIFRANRNGQEIRFVKATKEDWDNLPKNFDMIPNVIGSSSRPLFRLLETNDGTTKHQFDFTFSPITRYATANSIETGYSVKFNFGVGYTPTGIVVNPGIQVGSQKLTDFVYNDADGSFTATGTNGATAVIKYSNKPLIITDDYKVMLQAPQTGFAYINANLATASSNSLLFNSLIAEIHASLPSTQKVNRIQFTFNDAFGESYITYSFTGGKTLIYHNFTVQEDAVNKKLILVPGTWQANTGAVIAEPALLKKVDAELMNPSGLYVKKETFKIAFTNTIYTFTSSTTNFRMTTYAFQ
ncbi:hypothetical protein DMB65_18120 [Flavobacterium cheongpyeongense]|uniref:DUF4302 domain-containing protein n=1 Tax=Flavobacterium cheongpyeongense TaxID=2212651 RepID=A0A2V4BKQ9_9FLAO|nr:DUF4302 domain-containing protein [Flavobacterium cheongpyeongense]PXY39401.1 hypothetical protein DMB65_18120 [Flavobacterium cheongpyeongense]